MVNMLVSTLSGLGSSPGWGHYVLGQDTLLSWCLSPPRCIDGYRQIEFAEGGNPAMD